MLAGLLLSSLVSFHRFDPTLTNLLYPGRGVGNWLGLPGALIGGTLVEGLGTASLLLPLLLAKWFFSPRRRPAAWRYALHVLVAATLLSVLHGLADPAPGVGLGHPGLLGWAGARWVAATTGAAAGSVLLGFALLQAAARVAYEVPWTQRGAEGTALLAASARGLRHGTGRLRHRLGMELGRLGGALGDAGEAALDGIGRGLRHAGLSLRRRTAALNPVAYRPRLPRSAARSPEAWVARRAGAPAGPAPLAAEDTADGLDAWFRSALLDEPDSGETDPPGSGTGPRPAPERPAAAAAPGEAPQEVPEAWEKGLRHYVDNLDLDWMERVFRERRHGPEEPDFEPDPDRDPA